MPDAETIEAGTRFVEALKRFFEVIGPAWSLAIAVVFFGTFVTVHYLRARQVEKGWEKALAAKDEMIEQLNEQNRELRVQAMVVGGVFSKDEAVKLVYREDRLQLNAPNPEV
ncbi:MAG: hypothetical protein ACREXU_14235 [Gammaproteobacteria bacterium]